MWCGGLDRSCAVGDADALADGDAVGIEVGIEAFDVGHSDAVTACDATHKLAILNRMPYLTLLRCGGLLMYRFRLGKLWPLSLHYLYNTLIIRRHRHNLVSHYCLSLATAIYHNAVSPEVVVRRLDAHDHTDTHQRLEAIQVAISEADAALGDTLTHRSGVVGAVDTDAVVRRRVETQEPRAVVATDIAIAVAPIVHPATGRLYLLDEELALGGAHIALLTLIAWRRA